MRIIDPETEALLDAGFIRPIDVVLFLAASGLSVMTVILWFINHSEPWKIAILLIIVALILLFWILSVAYRACYFILKTRAIIETMPESAAKISHQYAMMSRTPTS